MTTKTAKAAAPKLEIWESTVPGRIAVEHTNTQGRPQTQQISGKGQRLRLTADDRELAEERIRHTQNNPFRNGMLVQINERSADAPPASDDELDDDSLIALFELTGEDFNDALAALSEVNVRRMKALSTASEDTPATVDASNSQTQAITTQIEERWPIGSDTPTYREMNRDPRKG